MNRLKYLGVTILALILAGCGQTVVESLKVSEGPSLHARGGGRSIVVLPFADYSKGNIESAFRRNLTITESLTDQLSLNGFNLPVQEDVFEYLVDQDVISLSPYEVNTNSTLTTELSNDWSDEMKGEIQGYIDETKAEHQGKVLASAGAHGLTTKELSKLGRHFNADYIMRGRILEYKTRKDPSWEPWKRGFIPFVNGGLNKIMFGFADSDEYDKRNEGLTGGWLAGLTAYGITDSAIGGLTWGAIGYGMGVVSHTSNQNADQAAVQMRIWVQDAATGDIVWTNRIRVLVSPESYFADNQFDALFNTAIDKGVTTLMDHFVTYAYDL
ncbi:MAG: hypothetical protein JRC87_08570 [Deltaproteobacteria bacterium]|nr:hypothetical protein [Deltaproteobacteria bacterium]